MTRTTTTPSPSIPLLFDNTDAPRTTSSTDNKRPAGGLPVLPSADAKKRKLRFALAPRKQSLRQPVPGVDIYIAQRSIFHSSKVMAVDLSLTTSTSRHTRSDNGIPPFTPTESNLGGVISNALPFPYLPSEPVARNATSSARNATPPSLLLPSEDSTVPRGTE